MMFGLWELHQLIDRDPDLRDGVRYVCRVRTNKRLLIEVRIQATDDRLTRMAFVRVGFYPWAAENDTWTMTWNDEAIGTHLLLRYECKRIMFAEFATRLKATRLALRFGCRRDDDFPF